MNYIFSNVHRFANDKDFVKALENVGFQDGDTLIFLNKAVPFDHAANFFRRFNIISLHRIHIVSTGEIKWFGEDEMLKRMEEYCDKTDSQNFPSGNRRVSMFYLDNAGVVKDRNGNVFWNIGIENYPSGKMPTTGFYAYNFALQCLKGGVTLVNFYGSQDSSTNKWNGHDWDYEELVLQNVPHRISISPPDWKSSDVKIRDATGSVKTVPWRDMGESDITSLWQQTWDEKSILANAKTPKVSVIMPVYNAESYLSEALASVLLQKSIPDVEVVCIDDGSSDNSAAILDFWKNCDSRLKVIRQENQGPGVARNVGLDVAKGEYIYFLDADDRISSGDILLRAYNQAKADKLDVLLADGSVMSENGIVTKRDVFLNRNIVPKEQVFSSDALGINLYIIATMGPSAKFFRREFLDNDNIRFPALKRSEDFPMVQLAITLARRIGVMPLSIFERRTDVITSRESTKDESPLIFAEAEQIFRSYLSEWELQDKYERAADVALIVRLAYNLRSVHQFASFRSIVHYSVEMFSSLVIKENDINKLPFEADFEFVTKVVEAANSIDCLVDIFVGIQANLRVKSLDISRQITSKSQTFQKMCDEVRVLCDRFQKERDEARSLRDKFQNERDEARNMRDRFQKERDEARNMRDRFQKERDEARNMRDRFQKERDEARSLRDKFQNERDEARNLRNQVLRERDEARNMRDRFQKERDDARSLRDKFLRERDEARKLRDKFLVERDEARKLRDKFLVERDEARKLRDRFLVERDKARKNSDELMVKLNTAEIFSKKVLSKLDEVERDLVCERKRTEINNRVLLALKKVVEES